MGLEFEAQRRVDIGRAVDMIVVDGAILRGRCRAVGRALDVVVAIDAVAEPARHQVEGDGIGIIEGADAIDPVRRGIGARSEEHTSELQSLMRISYAVFCLKKKKINNEAV